MKVLIVGSGGREHAIAWSVSKSPKVDKIYCAPGNAGIAELAECVNITAMEFDKLADFAQEKEIDLTIIGMDDPLVGGIVDVFEERGLKVFGPRKNAAILEGSKAFSKDLMKKYHIPTAAYENFDDPEKALEYLRTQAKFPIVLKADGLALGKGVLICNSLEEAEDGVKEIMEDKKFGNAGNTMVIEEFMTGREVSVLSFVDGKTITSVRWTAIRVSIPVVWEHFPRVLSIQKKWMNSAENMCISQPWMPWLQKDVRSRESFSLD